MKKTIFKLSVLTIILVVFAVVPTRGACLGFPYGFLLGGYPNIYPTGIPNNSH